MKNVIEAIKKEELMFLVLPIIVVTLTVFAPQFFGPVLEKLFETSIVTDLILSIMAVKGGEVIIAIIFAIILTLFIYLILHPIFKHDDRVNDTKKDERELEQEYRISHVSYKIMLYSIFACFSFFGGLSSTSISLIFVSVLAVRLGYRIHFEKELV